MEQTINQSSKPRFKTFVLTYSYTQTIHPLRATVQPYSQEDRAPHRDAKYTHSLGDDMCTSRCVLSTVLSIKTKKLSLFKHPLLRGVVKSYAGLATARAFLGLVEGPMFPAIVLHISGFYTRKELSLR